MVTFEGRDEFLGFLACAVFEGWEQITEAHGRNNTPFAARKLASEREVEAEVERWSQSMGKALLDEFRVGVFEGDFSWTIEYDEWFEDEPTVIVHFSISKEGKGPYAEMVFGRALYINDAFAVCWTKNQPRW